MKSTGNEQQNTPDALKMLRDRQKPTIEKAARMMKKQRRDIDAIRKQLKTGAKTVPELSEGTGIGSSQVMWYVATMKKYGIVAEGEKDGNYFRYELGATSEQDTNHS